MYMSGEEVNASNCLLFSILPWVYVMCILKYSTLISLIYRRSTEFSNAIKQTFETAVLVELFPRSQIDIYVQILQSDGGTVKTLNFIVHVIILHVFPSLSESTIVYCMECCLASINH